MSCTVVPLCFLLSLPKISAANNCKRRKDSLKSCSCWDSGPKQWAPSLMVWSPEAAMEYSCWSAGGSLHETPGASSGKEKYHIPCFHFIFILTAYISPPSLLHPIFNITNPQFAFSSFIMSTRIRDGWFQELTLEGKATAVISDSCFSSG